MRLLVWLNYSEISFPNKYPAPLGEIPHPEVMLSGSDQSKSHIGPSCGTSYILSSYLILSSVSRDGDNPPCKLNIFPSTRAVKGR